MIARATLAVALAIIHRPCHFCCGRLTETVLLCWCLTGMNDGRGRWERETGQVEEIALGGGEILCAGAVHRGIEFDDVKGAGRVLIVEEGTYPEWIDVSLHRHDRAGSLECLTEGECGQ